MRGGLFATVVSNDAVDQQPAPSTPGPGQAAPRPVMLGLGSLPTFGSMLIISSIGLRAGLCLVVGFLTAIAPLAILGALFERTTGIAVGWLATFIGGILSVLATSLTSSITLLLVEPELAHIGDVLNGFAPTASLDPQALPTIVGVSALVSVLLVLAAFRAASGLRDAIVIAMPTPSYSRSGDAMISSQTPAASFGVERRAETAIRTRAAAISDALTVVAQRDQPIMPPAIGYPSVGSRASVVRRSRGDGAGTPAPLGVAGRRSSGRRSGAVQRRDKR